MSLKRDRSIETTLLLEDVFAMLGALLLARLAHVGLASTVPGLRPPVSSTEYAHLLLVFLPTWIFAAERLGIHRIQALTGERSEIVRRVILTQAWGLTTIALILVAAQVAINRSLIVSFVVLSTVLLLAVKEVQIRWLRKHRGQSRVLLICAGPGDTSGLLTSEFARLRGRQVQRFTGDDPEALREQFRSGSVDEVVLVGHFPPGQVLAFVETCAEAGLPVFVPLEEPPLALPAPDIETVGKNHYIVYQPRELAARSLAIKGVLDRVLAALLIGLLAPVFLILAGLVRLLVGPGVIFVQRRGGLFGEPFSMLKFRTMRLGADSERTGLAALNEMDGPVFKIRNDPRVTSFGRILRRTSLDELPQLFNVLAGQMSLVGPRPLPVDETEALSGRHRRRLSMRPGLTCLWQVSGRSDLTFEEWMALDLEYVDRWSLGLDLAILLRTIPAIVSRKGAH
jgi:exopolysaccharide biosynthesis polyprenyl glycosylphosphotransferase